MTTSDDLRKQAEEEFRNIPSAEHRGHIRRFQGFADTSDEADVFLRGYVIWKRLNFALMEAAARVKRSTSRRSK